MKFLLKKMCHDFDKSIELIEYICNTNFVLYLDESVKNKANLV